MAWSPKNANKKSKEKDIKKSVPKSSTIDRVPTEIIGLDEKMEGGVPSGFIVLVAGNSGSMKTSISFSILYNAYKKHNKKGMYISLEQSKGSIITHVQRMGMPLQGMANPVIIDLAKVRKDTGKAGKEEKINWLESILKVIKKYKDAFGCKVLAFDSLAALYAVNEFDNPRKDLFYFFEGLRDTGLTTFLISEIPKGKDVYGIYGVEDFLSDGILHLKAEEMDTGTNIYLKVVKMRQTNHKRGFMPLIFDNGKFEVLKR
ncbi:MAG: ATPase domain-containing protein [Thermoplasmata archaeon]